MFNVFVRDMLLKNDSKIATETEVSDSKRSSAEENEFCLE